ncbi:MAG: mycofactocin system FadH/OYE family oxidoreductase 1 [Actinomycetes bacterium]
MSLVQPLSLGSRTVSNRVMFGPHVTNLGTDERSFSADHVAYYERRAVGGCGIIVVEGASVHNSDWPYERAPLASRSAAGWTSIAEACHRHGSLVIASLDHAGGQGSSAYSQQPLWAPSRVPEVNSREVPKWMEQEDIFAVIEGFAEATRLAIGAGCDGVEINAGQHSLVRQFLSGLTNQRSDEYADRLLFARQIVHAVKSAARANAIVGLRLSCDELAPWAGITPEMAPAIATELCDLGIDYIVVVRGSIFSAEKTRPDFHEPTGFNIDVCRSIRSTLPSHVAVFLQGSVVDVDQAESAINGGACDAVEMTRAQIADPDLVQKINTAQQSQIRPCIRCNQTCQVRDARNPIVTCVGEPSAGHESHDPDWYVKAHLPRKVLIVGAGVAGLEAARVAALRGHSVHLIEKQEKVGGLSAIAGPGPSLVNWLESETLRLGVTIQTSVEFSTSDSGKHDVVIQTTGGRRGNPEYEVDSPSTVLDIADIRRGSVVLPDVGIVAILDPIGGPIGVALAEELGARAILFTPDNIAGNELSRTGDLAPANVRLAQCGVTIQRRCVIRGVERRGEEFVVRVQDRFSGVVDEIICAAVVDAGFRLPTDPINGALQAGDCVAPRTILEAVLEGRRVAQEI